MQMIVSSAHKHKSEEEILLKVRRSKKMTNLLFFCLPSKPMIPHHFRNLLERGPTCFLEITILSKNSLGIWAFLWGKILWFLPKIGRSLRRKTPFLFFLILVLAGNTGHILHHACFLSLKAQAILIGTVLAKKRQKE